MAEGSDQEKTEPATGRKRDKARDEGQVAQTQELPSALVLAASLLVFSAGAGWLWEHFQDLFRLPFTWIGQMELTGASFKQMAVILGIKLVVVIAPVLGTVVLAGVGASVAQTGILIAKEAMTPKIERLDPLQGFKRFVSIRSLVDLVKNIAKIFVLGYVVYSTLRAHGGEILNLMNQPGPQVFALLMALIFKLFLRASIVLVVLAVLDYAFQRYEWERQLKMTKQEVIDEMKQSEGDPKIKARIRAMQREVAMRRMMQQVPKADVVITNPTHVAVALRYESPKYPAPRVVAKGKGFVAQRIRETARSHGVPVLERPELARLLYATVKLDRMIPEQLYQAVAEILAYVYALKGRRSAANDG
ncbi:MAG: flagellar biosynthesis protein FlhB [Myxococcales bacterium]|nr:flagellar biosynthesis protein FlhB [Myxococcales bacterium]